MKSTWLPILLVALAAGCTPPPSDPGSAPDGNTSSSDLSISIPASQEGDSQQAADTTGVETTLVSLSIPGMTCAGCAMEVKDTLSPLPGVVDVQTDPVKKTATVSVDADAFDSQAALETLAAARFTDSTITE